MTQRMLTGRWSGRYLWHAMDVTAGHRTPHVLFAVAAAVEGAEACTPRQFRKPLAARTVPHRLARRRQAHPCPSTRAERLLWEQEDFRAELSLQAPWQVASFIHRQLDRWAHAERDRLRDIRRINPTAQLCCPEAVASALALIAARNCPVITLAITLGARSATNRMMTLVAGRCESDSGQERGEGRSRWQETIIGAAAL